MEVILNLDLLINLYRFYRVTQFPMIPQEMSCDGLIDYTKKPAMVQAFI